MDATVSILSPKSINRFNETTNHSFNDTIDKAAALPSINIINKTSREDAVSRPSIWNNKSITSSLSAPSFQEPTSLPIAILHIGPRKTGTTSIQSFAENHASFLEKEDNLRLFSNARQFCKCHVWNESYSCRKKRQGPRSMQILKKERQHMELYNTSIFVSSEAFDQAKVQLSNVHSYFSKWTKIQVVSIYRRYFEFVVSLFGQGYRKNWNTLPNDGGSSLGELTNIVSFLSASLYTNSSRHSYEAYGRYQKGGYNVLVINSYYDPIHNHPNHNPDDIVQSLFCHPQIPTPNTCKHLLLRREQKQQQQQQDKNKVRKLQWENRDTDKEPTAYDEIGMAAYRAGLVSIRENDSKLTSKIDDIYKALILHKTAVQSEKKQELTSTAIKITRPILRQLIQHHHENGFNLTMADLPKLCPHATLIDQLEWTSLQYEKLILPSFFNSPYGETVHRKKFEEFKNKKKFCAIDTQQVLRDIIWQSFFETLSRYQQRL